MRLARGMTGDYGDNRKRSLLWGLWGLWGAGRPLWLARDCLETRETQRRKRPQRDSKVGAVKASSLAWSLRVGFFRDERDKRDERDERDNRETAGSLS